MSLLVVLVVILAEVGSVGDSSKDSFISFGRSFSHSSASSVDTSSTALSGGAMVVVLDIAGDAVRNGEAIVSSICFRRLRWGERITVSYFNFVATLIFTGLFCCSKLGDDEVDGVSSFACLAGGLSRCCC